LRQLEGFTPENKLSPRGIKYQGEKISQYWKIKALNKSFQTDILEAQEALDSGSEIGMTQDI